MNAPDQLPSPEEYYKLLDGLKNKVDYYMEELKEENSAGNWRSLAEAVEALLIVYNGKRGSDVAEMKLTDYQRAMNVPHKLGGPVFASLSAEEKDYAGRHFLVQVKGKRNRVNAVILTEKFKAAMDLLASLRSSCGVLSTNVYFFAIPSYTTYLNQTNALIKFKNEFNVQNMDTRLIRKNVSF